MEPVEFLRCYAPFSQLGVEGLGRLGRALEVQWAPAGEVILRQGGEPSRFVWVVRKGAVRLESDARAIDVLGPGESFGFPSLLSDSEPQRDAVALEDCLLYRLPAAAFRRLLEEPEFGDFFLHGLARRLRSVSRGRPSGALGGSLGVPARKLANRRPVTLECSANVGQAARRMREQRVSSVLVEGSCRGILTDRDLRTRVLAEGRGPETPVEEVVSRPLKTFPADGSLQEALLFMLRERIHHLPLEADGEVVGLITDSDLLAHQLASPSQLLRQVNRARSAEDLAEYSSGVAGMVETLHLGGTGASEIGRIVASLNDALVQRLVTLAEKDLGSPPSDYAWIVFGSEGRKEQALITDQDNALIFADDAGEGGERYFASLAERVVSDLEAVGFPRCAGDFMATKWRRPLSEWLRLFESWTEEPRPQALLEVANFFDFRQVWGGLDLEPLEEAIEAGARSRTFLAQLAKASLGMRPPIGLFHRIKEDDGGVDLKAGGLMPITGLARVVGLEARTRERSTLGRLEAARSAGALSDEGCEGLVESFRFLFALRLDAQLAALRRGMPPTHRVALESLGPRRRHHLKEAFLLVREMQEAMSQRLGLSLLG